MYVIIAGFEVRRPSYFRWIFQVKKGGGLSINSTVTLTRMSEKMAQLILHEYSILFPFTFLCV